MQADDFPLSLAKIVVSPILPRILRQPWDRDDIEGLFQFLIATHASEIAATRKETSLRASTKVATHSLQSTLEVFRSSPFKRRTVDFSKAANVTPDNSESIRNLVLQLVVGAAKPLSSNLLPSQDLVRCAART